MATKILILIMFCFDFDKNLKKKQTKQKKSKQTNTISRRILAINFTHSLKKNENKFAEIKLLEFSKFWYEFSLRHFSASSPILIYAN